MTPHDTLRIDVARLSERLDALAEVGAVHGPNGERGCARLALTDADREGRDLVVGWMRDLGLAVTVDGIGNVIGVRAGTDPDATPVMTGSHIDTVRTGGRFDGNLGVLGGLEVVEILDQHGIATRRPIAVAFFTNEEGARFQPDMLGSLVHVGGLSIEEALDIGLPRAYTPELHQQKCEAVFAHIKQAYPERDIQSTRIRPAEISSPLVKGKSICRPGR
jgi:N-carbamoyl-L-amino-acid hydrolase